MIDESAITGIVEWLMGKARDRFGIGGASIAFILCLVALMPLVVFLSMWLG
ncbi:hypothetical protein HNP52_000671 [Sphingomonas kyeonggiensis]|uniref:Uncharacterized protein n=1 Tax=Sphingomonas kyeonggiensis TaxID=1268553 RepID=A0A7W7NQ04_9SPHN|nr:hypothetical protein [Sphingomonas kyeonggiensis]MBB4837620.1 hypothetical protein [Sphingomonas kyeonggiensis]